MNEDVKDIYWYMLIMLEGRIDPKKDILDAGLVESAYRVWNKLNNDDKKPRWLMVIGAPRVDIIVPDKPPKVMGDVANIVAKDCHCGGALKVVQTLLSDPPKFKVKCMLCNERSILTKEEVEDE